MSGELICINNIASLDRQQLARREATSGAVIDAVLTASFVAGSIPNTSHDFEYKADAASAKQQVGRTSTAAVVPDERVCRDVLLRKRQDQKRFRARTKVKSVRY